jgi:hypothetical protein
MSEPDTGSTGKNGIKTLGIRYQPALHTQMSVIAQLRGRSFQDEVIAASEAHVAEAKADPELLSRIQAAIAEIDREATSRRDALTALFSPTEQTAGEDGSGAEQAAQPDPGSKASGQRRSGGGRSTTTS